MAAAPPLLQRSPPAWTRPTTHASQGRYRRSLGRGRDAAGRNYAHARRPRERELCAPAKAQADDRHTPCPRSPRGAACRPAGPTREVLDYRQAWPRAERRPHARPGPEAYAFACIEPSCHKLLACSGTLPQTQGRTPRRCRRVFLPRPRSRTRVCRVRHSNQDQQIRHVHCLGVVRMSYKGQPPVDLCKPPEGVSKKVEALSGAGPPPAKERQPLFVPFAAAPVPSMTACTSKP